MNFIHRANSSHIHLTFAPLFNRRLAFPWDEIYGEPFATVCVRENGKGTLKEYFFLKTKKKTMVDGVRWHEQDLDAFLIHLCLCFCAVILSSFRFFFYLWLLDRSVPLWSVRPLGGIDTGDYTPVCTAVTAEQSCPCFKLLYFWLISCPAPT